MRQLSFIPRFQLISLGSPVMTEKNSKKNECTTYVQQTSGSQETDGSMLRLPMNFSPTKGRPKSVRNSPRGKCQQDCRSEWEKNRVRHGSGSYPSPRGSPNGKLRGNPSKSPRQSPTYADLYAGFSDSPAPAALPKPPSHWMCAAQLMAATQSCHSEAAGFAANMKLLLNAQA